MDNKELGLIANNKEGLTKTLNYIQDKYGLGLSMLKHLKVLKNIKLKPEGEAIDTILAMMIRDVQKFHIDVDDITLDGC